jgi:hypothetical protein
LECDGSEVETDRDLKFFFKETLMMLNEDEIWSSSTTTTLLIPVLEVTEQELTPIEKVDKVKLMSSFEQYKIPFNLFPAAALARMNVNMHVDEFLRDIIHLIINDMRQISSTLPLPVIRRVVDQLCEKYPNSFTTRNKDGTLTSKKNEQMIIKFVNRNNQINRGQRETNVAETDEIHIKKRRTHQSQTTVVPNWNSPSSSTSSQSSVIQNKTQLTSQTDSETAKIIMLESFATIRNMLNTMESIERIKNEWPLLFKQPFLSDHFLQITCTTKQQTTDELNAKIDLIVRYGKFQRDKKVRAFFNRNKALPTNLLCVSYVAFYFKEKANMIFKVTDSETEYDDLIILVNDGKIDLSSK